MTVMGEKMGDRLTDRSANVLWIRTGAFFLRNSESLGQDDCLDIVECWYFISLPILLSKLHLLNYSDVVTQESIVITLFIRACKVCDVLYVIISVITPSNIPGYD
jgi:hypothetical protein